MKDQGLIFVSGNDIPVLPQHGSSEDSPYRRQETQQNQKGTSYIVINLNKTETKQIQEVYVHTLHSI